MALVNLKKASESSELTTRQLQWMIRRGRLTAYQPGGPRGKLYVEQADLEALMQPRQVHVEQK